MYPPECDSCQNPAGPFLANDRLCGACFKKLVAIQSPYCSKCAEPFPAAGEANFICANCEGRKLGFDFAFAPYESRGPVRELIHEFKYNRKIHLRSVLGWMLEQGIAEPRIMARSDWILVPVPLHGKRMREREFNQSYEIARALQKATGFHLLDGLQRNRYTTGQAKLGRKGRLENLKGAFNLKPSPARRESFRDRHILLVDDVLTTGATLHECATVLKKEGHAAQVVGLCVARG